MTRKDFEKIAGVLSGSWHLAPNGDAAKTVWLTTLSMADVLAQSNPRFDRDRFYVAVFGVDMWEAKKIAYGWA